VDAAETYDVSVMGKEDVDYGRSALIVWDMQNGIARNAINFDQLLRNVRILIDTSHTNSVPVIYSQHTGLPSEFQSKYMRLSLQRRGIPEGSTFMAEGSQEWKIVKELVPLQGKDIVLQKHTASFFLGTPLEQLLRNRGIEAVILCGVATEAGIEGTARHASQLGFYPVIVEDAVGSRNQDLHENSLKVMRQMFDVQPTEETVHRLRRV
jgi:nicotinamidase-related amidase